METTIRKIKETLKNDFSASEVNSIIRIIFGKLKNYSQVDIIMHKDDELSPFIKTKVDEVLERLLKHEPIQYIFNEAYFQGFTLKVTPHTLIPRPETEELVDIITKENKKSDLHILDIGTGSGAIAIALARALPFPDVDAIDISEEALQVAKDNAESLKAKVNFIKADILCATPPVESYDIIVSNPPYISEEEYAELDAGVRDFEPRSALVPGPEGMEHPRAVEEAARLLLKPGGLFLMEHGWLQGEACRALCHEDFWSDVHTGLDLAGKDRFLFAVRTEKK